MDSQWLPRCRSCALLAALAALLAACGDDDAQDLSDANTGTMADAAASPDAGPDSGSNSPDASVISPDVTAIGVGNNVVCAVLSTGKVRCWGANEQGQVGGGDVSPPKHSPTEVFGLNGAESIDCGTATCCARTQSGGVQCWGWNDQGALGADVDPITMGNRATPGPVILELKAPVEMDGVDALAVGGLHACVLRSGSVACWGWNQAGQGGQTAGSPPGLFRATETAVVSDATHIATAKCFLAEHTCAITLDGTASCWGYDDAGQLGDGVAGGARGTASSVAGLTGVTALAAGSKHTCAIADVGAGGRGVFCWGLNDFGQAGPAPSMPAGGPPPLQLTPTLIPGLANATALAAGQSHTCALLSNQEARCWGATNFGQLGGGLIDDVPHPDPVEVTTGKLPLTGIIQLSAGYANTCAVTIDGQAFCWGANDIGQLGQGITGGPESLPIQVPMVP
jgi:alpha-tubulin suppressor-like RCC1 family protein